jgi:putative nucleotidyltransferase with HDIG domain
MTEENVVSNGSSEDKELQILLEPTYPLLQEFRELCPGTFKHSQNMAGIIEGIALVLGLNVLKMKVAAMYHDIGKLFSPIYFTENQAESDGNPHDKLLPDISYNLITRHISDTVIILVNDHRFPRDIIEIVSQHHGTSVLQFFYNKSGKIEKGVEDTFRYKTTKPTCVESAILMIVDRIEATSRSLSMVNKFDPIQIIDKTINSLIDDSQLDNVLMRLCDLKKTKEALVKELKGTYSKRVDYDKAKEDTDNTIDNSILDGESK